MEKIRGNARYTQAVYLTGVTPTAASGDACPAPATFGDIVLP